jgi:hypothetical protein
VEIIFRVAVKLPWKIEEGFSRATRQLSEKLLQRVSLADCEGGEQEERRNC